MNSPAAKTIPTTPSNSLSSQLQQIGLYALPAQLDDFIARATKARWSPHQILEQLVQAEGAERSRRSLERRLRISGIKSFKLFPAGYCRATAAATARRVPRLLAPQTSQALPRLTVGRLFKKLRFLVIANNPCGKLTSSVREIGVFLGTLADKADRYRA
jgi:hypothetical protein